jgi:hypothetical protein
VSELHTQSTDLEKRAPLGTCLGADERGFGAPVNWIATGIVRIEAGILAAHRDVIQDEATEEQSKSGAPMFGTAFPDLH